MSNPRHFKLKVSTFDGTLFRLFFNSFVVPGNFKTEEQLEVIEYFAYEQLQKEIDRLNNKYDFQFLVKKNEQLEKENYRLRCEKQADLNKIELLEFTEKQAYDRLAEEKAKSQKLVEALEFYSTDTNEKVIGQIEWNPHVCDQYSGLMYAPDWDGSLQDEPNEIALKALKEYKGEK